MAFTALTVDSPGKNPKLAASLFSMVNSSSESWESKPLISCSRLPYISSIEFRTLRMWSSKVSASRVRICTWANGGIAPPELRRVSMERKLAIKLADCIRICESTLLVFNFQRLRMSSAFFSRRPSKAYLRCRRAESRLSKFSTLPVRSVNSSIVDFNEASSCKVLILKRNSSRFLRASSAGLVALVMVCFSSLKNQ
ncbi:hypothetical protein SDC9_156115 [bioreactor metagenome]|uniref:Uncharacterized protein n=1 Tax=bioreactor metagenome TaxID=1076179 RepID=A0A645F5X2_9ZZZZ